MVQIEVQCANQKMICPLWKRINIVHCSLCGEQQMGQLISLKDFILTLEVSLFIFSPFVYNIFSEVYGSAVHCTTQNERNHGIPNRHK